MSALSADDAQPRPADAATGAGAQAPAFVPAAAIHSGRPLILHDPLLDYRARLERDQFEAAERRNQALLDQCSPERSHDQRVRVWETLHQVKLPRSPVHAVLRVIAQHTHLTLAEVQEVQRSRTVLPASAPR